MTTTERRLAAQKAAHTRWSRPGARQAQAEKASRALLDRFEKQLDAEAAEAGITLQPDERHQLVQSRLAAHMAGLSLKAVNARRRKRQRAKATT